MLKDIEFIKAKTRLRNPKYDPKTADQTKELEFIDQPIYIQPGQVTMFYELPDDPGTACVFLEGASDLPAAVSGKELDFLKARIKKQK